VPYISIHGFHHLVLATASLGILRATNLRTRLRRLQRVAGGESLAAPEAALGAREPAEGWASRLPEVWTRVVPALFGFVAVGALAAGNGGYFPTAWGWSTLAFISVASVALVVATTVSFGWLELLFLAGLTAFAGWIAISLAWSGTPETVLEVERSLVYLAGTLALLLVVRRRALPDVLGGMLTAIVLASAYGLATRLLPDRLGVVNATAVSRLAEPLGYWNALGIFAAIGSLLALGFAARARSLALRSLAAAAPAVLVPTLYFTFGRGPWIAFGVGIVAALGLDPRRLQLTTVLLILAPAPAVAVWLGSRSDALTRNQPEVSQAAVHDGHRLAIVILLLAAATAAVAAAFAYAEKRIEVGRVVQRVYGFALLLALVALLGGVFVRFGGPTTIARNGYDAFKGPGVGITQPGSNLNKRLFNLSGNGRYDFWRIAWRDYEDHPLLGSGAGTFERYWLRHRPFEGTARDAHSLYFETLAELGPLGLALLLAALAVPFAAAVRARRHAFVPAAFGGYVAFVAHAGVDWDWEMTAVTVTGLFCGAALLVAARGTAATPMRPAFRAAALLVTLALGACAYVGLRGNQAIAASEAATGTDPSRSAAAAREAERWAPWSARAKLLLAQAQLGLGNEEAARATLAEATAKDSGDWELWGELAVASKGAARRQALAVAIRLNPRDSGLAEYLASLKPPASRRR
jgi:O-antigen ligase